MSPPRPSSLWRANSLSALRQPGRRREAFASLAIPNDLDGAHQSHAAADLSDDGVAIELLQPAEQVIAHARRVVHQTLALHDVEVGEPGRARHGVATEGDPVVERGLVAAEECVGDVLARDRRTDRQVATRQRLRDDCDVWHHAPVLGSEHPARAAEPGDHLVADEQDAAPVADLPDHRPVLGMGDVHARRCGDRLTDHGGYRARTLVEDCPLDLPRRYSRSAEALSAPKGDRYWSGPCTRTAPGKSGP